MAEFTFTVQELLDSGYDIKTKALTNYKVSDDEWKEELNEYLLMYYADREVAFPTADMFSRYLNRAMVTIMPYYDVRRQIDLKLAGIDPTQSFSTLEKIVLTGELSNNGTRNQTTEDNSTDKRTDDFKTTGEHSETTKDDTTDTRTDDLKNSTTTTVEGADGSKDTRTDALKQTNTESTMDGGTETKTRTDNLSETTNGSTTHTGTESTEGSHSTTNGGYTKNYDFPISGGSTGNTGNEGSGFSDDFVSSGQVTHNTETGSESATKTNNLTDTTNSTRTNTGTQEDKTTRALTGSSNGTIENAGTVTNDHTGTSTSTGTETGTNTGTSANVRSGTVAATGNESGTNAGTSENVHTGNGTLSETTGNTQNTTQTTEHTTSGNQSPTYELLAKYRDVIENINGMIVHDKMIEKCFLGVFGVGGTVF